MTKRFGQLGMRATITGACLVGALSMSAQAQEAGYTPPHVDTSGTNLQPAYPATAVVNGEQGSVGMEVLVGSDGKVRDMRLQKSSGYDDLDNAALAAVWGWKFIPASRNSQYYQMPKWGQVAVQFQLPNGPQSSGH
jgi:protein TonB